MSPLLQVGTAFALIILGAIAGAYLRKTLPEHHLTGDSKDVIRLAVGLTATMAALVLALLFASTRASFDRTSGYVSRMTADVTELDKLLGQYGPAGKPIREALRTEIGPLIASIWRESAAPPSNASTEAKGHGDSVLYMLRALEPANKVEASLQARALRVSTDLQETQLSLASQPSDSLSNTFIVVLVIWLMFIFAVFSMSSPPNATLCIVLLLSILSASAAIYLILELAQPFDGLMQVSNEGLRGALKPFD